jgi:putative ABC transport system ATP-binding protein
MQTMTALIELKNVERSYPLAGGRSWVLRNINLAIAEGEFISIMGPSGSGKTSLLNVLGLMDAEFAGEYVLDGREVHALGSKQRQALQRETIGFIFQHYHLIDDLTVAVARAVITRPKVLLADEPTGALHSSQGKLIMELLAELNAEGATIVQVTHSAENATYGQRVIELQDGWLKEAS